MRTATAARPVRRVRHEVRDSLAVMAFSAGASAVVALLLTVALPGLAGIWK